MFLDGFPHWSSLPAIGPGAAIASATPRQRWRSDSSGYSAPAVTGAAIGYSAPAVIVNGAYAIFEKVLVVAALEQA